MVKWWFLVYTSINLWILWSNGKETDNVINTTQIFNHNLCTDFFILSIKSTIHGKEYNPKNAQEKSVPSQVLAVSQQGICHIYAAHSNI